MPASHEVKRNKYLGKQQPSVDKLAMYELLTSGVMRGAVITFRDGITYEVGAGWRIDDEPRTLDEMRPVLRELWVRTRGKGGRRRGSVRRRSTTGGT